MGAVERGLDVLAQGCRRPIHRVQLHRDFEHLLAVAHVGAARSLDRAGVEGQFGEERLAAAFDGRAPGELVDGIYAAVRAHAGDALGDDVTLVALRARESQ